MADIKKLSQLVDGVQRQVDLTDAGNSVVIREIKYSDDGGTSSTDLSKTVLDSLIAAEAAITSHLDGGANKHDASEIDVEASDGVNHTQADLETVVGELDDALEARTRSADLADAATAGKGAGLVGFRDPNNQFTSTDVEGALDEALDAAQAAQAALDSHLDGGASKHDASEIDVEAADGANHSAGDLESVVGELDDAIEARAKSADLASTAASEGASLIGVQDAGLYFTGNDVEAALQEIGSTLTTITAPMNYTGDITVAGMAALTNMQAGDYYLVTDSGTFFGVDFAAGDHFVVKQDLAPAISSATEFTKVDNTEASDILRSGDLSSAQMFVGNASNQATAVSMGGEASMDNAGAVTLDNDSVIAKL